MSYNRMTIKDGKVYKLKPHWSDNNLGGGNNLSFYLPVYAAVRFEGSYDECKKYIAEQGAEFAAH